jgi:hypothetical protein
MVAWMSPRRECHFLSPSASFKYLFARNGEEVDMAAPAKRHFYAALRAG